MKTIWKFEIEVADEVAVIMPRYAEILAVQSDGHDTVNLWAVVDSDYPTEERRFRIRGTGHPLLDVGKYVGTASTDLFVWHVFEAP